MNGDNSSKQERVPKKGQSGNDNTKTSRRSVLAGMGTLGAAGILGSGGGNSLIGAVSAQEMGHSSPELTPFVDELPIPTVLKPKLYQHLEKLDLPQGANWDSIEELINKFIDQKDLAKLPLPDHLQLEDLNDYYEVEMRQTQQKLHRDLPKTTVWGYNGQFPGPTIEARQGNDIYVKWENKLPRKHLLPVDTTIGGAHDNPAVRTVTHLHGANVESASDGGPDGWFTRNFEQRGPRFQKKVYHYDNNQPATTLWYHDHALGITRLNVYAGLAGFYLLRPKKHKRKYRQLPSGEYEIPLVFQDRSFNDDGSLYYPTQPDTDEGREDPDPSIVPEFFADTAVVNGKVWPRLKVNPRKYRFRTLNGCNGRFLNLKLLQYDENTDETTGDGPSFIQIGSDGGFLEQPVEITDRLLWGPANRQDLVVDFSDYAGDSLLLHNNAPVPFGGEVGPDVDDAQSLPKIMLFEVEDCKTEDKSRIPNHLARIPKLHREDARKERELTLNETTDEYDRLELLLGNREHPNGLHWEDEVMEMPKAGTTEVWNFVNRTVDTHPMHMHLVQFQILGKRPYDVDQYNQDVADGNLKPLDQYYTGDLISPNPENQGWNDTVAADPGYVTQVIAHFGEYQGLFNTYTGRYPWHCHILPHEDHDMMRPYKVVSSSDGNDGHDHRDHKGGNNQPEHGDHGGRTGSGSPSSDHGKQGNEDKQNNCGD